MATSDTTGPSVKVLGRRLLARNQVYEIYLDDLVDHSGLRVRDYLAVVPNNVDEGGYTGVAVLPVRSEGGIGLVRVFRHPRGATALEVPKGFIDRGESPRQAAERELVEETGLVAPRFVDLGSLWPVPGVIQARIALFAAVGVRPAKPVTGSDPGLGGLEYLPCAAVVAMADSGEIEEPCTLVAIYRYLRASGTSA